MHPIYLTVSFAAPTARQSPISILHNVATTSTTNGTSGTIPTSIDTAGDIAGTYTDTSGARHSFVRAASGTITPFDPPGTNTNPCASTGMGKILCGSVALGMDDAMDIVGTYFDSTGVAHGFLRYGSSGTFVTVTPSAAGTGALQGAAFFAVNASGTMAGTYADSNSMLHGFTYSLPIIATTTTLTPAPTPNPSVFGEPLTLSATVASGNGTPPNGENVDFLFNTVNMWDAQLSKGAATDTVCCMAAGTYSITASYVGDSTFVSSTSSPVSQVINQASSATTLTSSASPSTFGQSVNLTAIVSGQFGGTPTGSVAFSNGGTSLGSVTLGASNQAVLTTAALPVGTNSITAVYSGDANFTSSTSAVLSQVVDAAPDFTLSINPASVSVTAGGSGTTTITVQDIGGFNGNVSFACSGLPAGATCSFTLETVPTPAGVSYSTLTVTTSASTASLHRNSSPLLPGSALAVALCCFGWKKRRRLQMLLLVAMSIAGVALLNGCGGGGSTGGSGGTQPVTSTITVTAASGSLSHTTTFTLTVN